LGRRLLGRDVTLKLDGIHARLGNSVDKRMTVAKAAFMDVADLGHD